LALFVILAGALLVLGGAISLLAGFDIVMTERGSAMTIGGTVALSGGTITLGIGFALLRLSQILGVLQANVEAELHEESAEKPVASAIASTAPELIPTHQPDLTVITASEAAKSNDDDTILVSPLQRKEIIEAPKKPGFFRTGTNLTGAAIAGTGLAGAAILAAATASANDAKESVPLGADQTLPEATDAVAAATKDVLPLDLEAELSRALAEDIPALPPLETKPEELQSEENSFNEGLTQILAKPKKRGKRESISSDSSSQENVTEPAIEPESDTTIEADEAVASSLADGKMIDGISQEEQPLNGPNQTDAAINNMQNTTPDARPTILGTYNASDGTYVMYSDGTVEAITEQGVRLFNSMEELRSHLAQT
jgi:hypothetical protein